MIELGKKIKAIRIEKGLTQANLAPDHQNNSLISHIENGTTKSPSRNTLDVIADRLGMTFDELIKDTDYQPEPIKSGTIAISETDFEVTVFDKYNFFISRKYYPRYDSTGKENKYCPKFGTSLVSYCADCNKNIEDYDSNYCMGCGSQLFYDFSYLTRSENGQSYLNQIWQDKKIRDTYRQGSGYYFWIELDDLDEDTTDLIGDLKDYQESGFDHADILHTIKVLFGNKKSKRYSPDYEKWSAKDFLKGPRSEIKELSVFFTQWITKNNFIQQYSIEVDKILQNPEESNFQPNEVKPDSN